MVAASSPWYQSPVRGPWVGFSARTRSVARRRTRPHIRRGKWTPHVSTWAALTELTSLVIESATASPLSSAEILGQSVPHHQP